VLLGVPVFFVWSRSAIREPSPQAASALNKFLENSREWLSFLPPSRFPRYVLEASEEGAHTLRRTLGPVNLITLGIGAIIGAGIFVLTGTAAAQFAGSRCRGSLSWSPEWGASLPASAMPSSRR